MSDLNDFYAKGASFSEQSRLDVSELLDVIPPNGNVHLAILQPPYLELINEGTKTIESRFSMNRAAPFGKVAVGDLVLLKHSGQAVSNYFFAAAVHFIDLRQEGIETVRKDYAQGICAQNQEEFWQARQNSRYCTLIEIGEKGDIAPLLVYKKDQRGWVSFVRYNQPGDDTLF